MQGGKEPEQQDVAGSRSTAFHQTAPSREPGSHQVSERREGRFRAELGVRSSEEDEMAGGETGRHEKTDAATVAVAFLDINSARPYCANLIGNVSVILLGLGHTLASK